MNIFAIFENIQERLSYELEIETKKLEKVKKFNKKTLIFLVIPLRNFNGRKFVR